WEHSKAAARKIARHSHILCLGSSSTKMGLIPLVIEERTGRRTYNIALMAGRMPANYFLFRRALECGARPQAVLIDLVVISDVSHVSEGHRTDLRKFHRCWAELLSIRDTFDLAWEARDPEFLAGVLLRSALRSFKAQDELRTAVLGALTGKIPRRRSRTGPI